jgi:putative PIN family toxin of toxin-antitoxin system
MNHEPSVTRLNVVLDTNIYISEFVRDAERSDGIWAAARKGQYRLVTSPAIIREIARVLRSKFDWQQMRIERQIRIINGVAKIVASTNALSLVDADPDDNRILECAVAGAADLIVSNDHHLLDLKSCRGIPIVSGPVFRRTLGLP